MTLVMIASFPAFGNAGLGHMIKGVTEGFQEPSSGTEIDRGYGY